MIRINLSGAARPKGKRAAAAAAVPEFGAVGEGPSPVVFALIGLALLGIVVGLPYLWISRESSRLDTEKKKADADLVRLQTVKTRVEQKQKLAEDIKRRTDAIDKLRKEQAGPAELLNLIGETINNTDAVWLSTMKDDGANINLEGVAFSPHAVANLISNLKRTSYFKSVELKETIQDESVKDMQAFNFTIVCEKKPRS